MPGTIYATMYVVATGDEPMRADAMKQLERASMLTALTFLIAALVVWTPLLGVDRERERDFGFSPDEPLIVHVVDAHGVAIAGARVSVLAAGAQYVSQAGRLSPVAFTDGSGTCKVPFTADASRPAKLHVIAPGHLPFVQALHPGNARFDIVLGDAASLTVRFESIDGRLPRDLIVTLSHDEMIPDDIRTDPDPEISPLGTDEFPVHRSAVVEGRKTFSSLEPGNWTVSVASATWRFESWHQVLSATAPGPDVAIKMAEPSMEAVVVTGDRLLDWSCSGDERRRETWGETSWKARVEGELRNRWQSARIVAWIDQGSDDSEKPFQVTLRLARTGTHIIKVAPKPISEWMEPLVFDASALAAQPVSTGEVVLKVEDALGHAPDFDGFDILGPVRPPLVDPSTREDLLPSLANYFTPPSESTWGWNVQPHEVLALPVGEFRLMRSMSALMTNIAPDAFSVVANNRTEVSVRLPHSIRPLWFRSVTEMGRNVSASTRWTLTVDDEESIVWRGAARSAPLWVQCMRPMTLRGKLADGRTCEEVVTVPEGEGVHEVVLTLR